MVLLYVLKEGSVLKQGDSLYCFLTTNTPIEASRLKEVVIATGGTLSNLTRIVMDEKEFWGKFDGQEYSMLKFLCHVDSSVIRVLDEFGLVRRLEDRF